jgi:DNA-directed RNA polymerase subunit RPC12/RpoP
MNLTCEECGETIPKELLKGLKNGEYVFCESCGAKICPDMILKEERNHSKSNERNINKHMDKSKPVYSTSAKPFGYITNKSIKREYPIFKSSCSPYSSYFLKVKAFLNRVKRWISHIFHQKPWKARQFKRNRGKKGRRRRHGR